MTGVGVTLRHRAAIEEEVMNFASRIFFIASALSACDVLAEEGASYPLITMEEARFIVSDMQVDQQLANISLAPIRSRADLHAYLNSNRNHPLMAFSDASRKRFLESLTFNETGVTGYGFVDMESELTPRQAYAILSLFGVQASMAKLDFNNASPEERKVSALIGIASNDRPSDGTPGDDTRPGDYKNYMCSPPATCVAARGAICIASNCR